MRAIWGCSRRLLGRGAPLQGIRGWSGVGRRRRRRRAQGVQTGTPPPPPPLLRRDGVRAATWQFRDGKSEESRTEEQERERERTGTRLILELLLPSATELLWGDWAPPGPLARWAMKVVARSRQFLLPFRIHIHHSQHPAMTRPGLEPGISGSGGRRLIH